MSVGFLLIFLLIPDSKINNNLQTPLTTQVNKVHK